MQFSSFPRFGLTVLLPFVVVSALFNGCGSGGGGGESTAPNNVALGPVSDALVSVYTLDGNKLFETRTTKYDPQVDLSENNLTLVDFDHQKVGKFTVKLPSDLDSQTLLLVKTDGGTDIDPNDDGNVTTGEFRALNGSLFAYATVSDLLNGRVTVNAFTTLAAEFAMQQNLKDRDEINSLLSSVAGLVFSDAVSGTMLRHFNPARRDADGNIADLSLLSEPGMYDVIMASATLQESYTGATHLFTDTDKEGLYDDLERMLGSDVNNKNTDGDALNDYGELFAGTDPLVSDTDAHKDQLYEYQWHLENTGQDAGSASGGTPGNDIDVSPVWASYAGSRRICVGVVDTGIEALHPDLTSNLDRAKSIRYSDGSNDPSPDAYQLKTAPYLSTHGTGCAGLVAARGWNDIGVRGVAPVTKLAGYNVFSAPTEGNFLDALSQEVDVSSNSWGYGSDTLVSDPTMVSVFKSRAEAGRDGKGTVFVLAAGNDRGSYLQDANGKKYYIGNANNADILNNPYVITVAAVDADGHFSSYSNFGANLLVSAPGGEFGVEHPAIVTTDLTGLRYGFESTGFANDYRGGVLFDVPGNEDGSYTNYMNGTSSATPIVSGVVALLLGVNPELTYRDVRYILATTASKNDPSNIDWTVNGAGLHINHNYGFGRVDAKAAVTKAETFTHLAPAAVSAKQTVSPSLPIPDNDATGIASTINVPETMTVEHVDVWVSIPDHAFPGDLDITLVSPAGTESRLAYGGAYYVNGTYNNWRFSTERCLDENAAGTWTLRVKDLNAIDTGTLTSWSLQISGR